MKCLMIFIGFARQHRSLHLILHDGYDTAGDK